MPLFDTSVLLCLGEKIIYACKFIGQVEIVKPIEDIFFFMLSLLCAPHAMKLS